MHVDVGVLEQALVTWCAGAEKSLHMHDLLGRTQRSGSGTL